MEQIIKKISSFLGILATLATLVMMVAIAADVVFRVLYSKSFPGLLELSETALVTAVFLGLAYTGSTNSHIAVDLLTERLPPKITRYVLNVAWGLTVIILVWMIYATTLKALSATEEGETRAGLVNWPLWPGRWIVVVGLCAMLLVALVNAVRTLVGKEVIGHSSEERLTDTPEHPYEVAFGERTESVAVGDQEAAHIANQEGQETS